MRLMLVLLALVVVTSVLTVTTPLAQNEIATPSGIKMVKVSPGTFTMGSPSNESGRDDDEHQHRVNLHHAFWLGKTEVTQRQWTALMKSNPSEFRGDDRPVENVTWFDCIRFCNAQSEKDGFNPAYRISGQDVTWDRFADGYRLPTEAEWEYACRAETNGPYSGNLDAMAWYGLPSGTRPVGTLKANPWGLHDMHGNVWEWCWDWGDSYPVGEVSDPIGPETGTHRVSRGGCWHNSPGVCRSGNRFGSEPSTKRHDLGLRLLRPLQEMQGAQTQNKNNAVEIQQ